jgi:hypothetical protein
MTRIVAGGAGVVIQRMTAAVASTPTSIAIKAIGQTLRRRAVGSMGLASVPPPYFAISASSTRASPMSRRRSRGSLRTQRWRSATRRFGVPAGNALQSGSRVKTAAIVSEIVSPSKASFPDNISKRTHPKDQMSARLSTPLPRACSGDM